MASKYNFFYITHDWWQYHARRQLAEMGVTYEEISERHELRNMTARMTKWWMMFGNNYDTGWVFPQNCPTCFGPQGPWNCGDPYHRIRLDFS